MSRQRKRHLARMPLEETVRLGTFELVAGAGSVYVEVQDHDNIQGLLVVIELNPGIPTENAQQLCEKVGSYLRHLAASNPSDRCLAKWYATFEKKGQAIASVSAHDRPSGAAVA